MKSKIIILTASNCLTKKNDSKPIVILSEAKRSRRIQRAELTKFRVEPAESRNPPSI